MNEKELAWLAGFMDGEGSIGILLQTLQGRGNRPYYLTAAVQLSTTSIIARDEVLRILGEMGITKFGYSYQEKKPEIHKPAHFVRVTRLADIQQFCKAMFPYAVLKKEQWMIMYEYTESRLKGIILRSDGTMPRGGNRPPRPFNEFEIECAHKLFLLNHTGPNEKEHKEEWLKKLQLSI